MGKKRVVYFDILNITAALSVIFLHCNGNSFYYIDTLGWKQAMLVEAACYWAVPVFLMLSGANLMTYRSKYTTKQYFLKRFTRTVIPFIAWSLLVAVEKGINPLEIGIKEFLSKIFNCTIEGVYWFFIPLFSVYLSMPVLSLLKDNKRILWYMAGGAFVLNSVLPKLFGYMNMTYNFQLSMMTVTGMLIFPIIGYLFAITDFGKLQRAVFYILAIFGLALRYFGTWYLSARDGTLNNTFYGYTGYCSVFLACGVFIFFKYFKPFQKLADCPRACNILSIVSGCSFGIYLMHMTVYRFLERYLEEYSWEWRLLVPFLIYFVALAVTFLLKKIPLLKHIVP